MRGKLSAWRAFVVQHAEPHETYEGGAVVRRLAVAQAGHQVGRESCEPVLVHGGGDDADVVELEWVHREHELGRVEQCALRRQVKLVRSAVAVHSVALLTHICNLLAQLHHDLGATSRLLAGLVRRLLCGLDQIDQVHLGRLLSRVLARVPVPRAVGRGAGG